MIAHTSLPVSDYKRSKSFYSEALQPLGYTNNMEYGEAAGFNDGKNTDFWITKEKTVVPLHVAFEANSNSGWRHSTKRPLRPAARTTAHQAIATIPPATTQLSSTTRTATTSRPSGTTRR